MANITSSAQAFTLYWIAESKQSSIQMGEYPTREAAEAAIPAAKAEMLDQCGEDFQRASIEAGTFSIDAPTE